DIADPQAAHGLYHKIVKFIGVCAAAIKSDAFTAIYGLAVGVGIDERFVAGLLNVAGDLVVRLVPGDVLPLGGTRTPYLRLQQPAIIHDFLEKRRALGAQSAAINRMVGVAFNVDHLRGHVLGLIAKRVNDHTAAH